MRVLAAILPLLLLAACSEEAVPLPSAAPIVIAVTSNPVTERPEITSSPEAAPRQALASEYLPFEDIFLRYYDEVSGETIECAIEFFSEETGLVQRHFTGIDKSRIEVSQYRDGSIMRMYQLSGIDYFQNFTRYVPAPERETLIKEPISLGSKWEIPGGTREITALDKHVQFPNRFGEFSVLEVTTRYDDNGLLVQQYMKNVGLVAESYINPNGELVRNMQVIEREKGRAITKIVRFYYVLLEKMELRYIDREITLRTNADLKEKFADEWRNVPPGSGLVPLSPDVRITRMYPREDAIIIDFTDALIHSMRIGPDGERLLIQAITNTLADYYGLERVYIYAGGFPYESQSTNLDPLGYLMSTTDALEYK